MIHARPRAAADRRRHSFKSRRGHRLQNAPCWGCTESQRLGLRKGQREAYDRNPLCPLCSTSDQDETARIFRRLPCLALSRKNVNFCCKINDLYAIKGLILGRFFYIILASAGADCSWTVLRTKILEVRGKTIVYAAADYLNYPSNLPQGPPHRGPSAFQENPK